MPVWVFDCRTPLRTPVRTIETVPVVSANMCFVDTAPPKGNWKMPWLKLSTSLQPGGEIGGSGLQAT